MNDVPAAVLKAARKALRILKQYPRRGQTLVEYALILAIVSVVAISVLLNMGTEIKSVYSVIDSQVAASASH